MQDHRRGRWPIVLGGLALVYLVGVVFLPILGFEFVDFDVGQQVVDNVHIRGLTGENLKHIFSSPCIYSYYPIRTLSFVIDYEFWGLNPTGFKLTNGLIHLANVFLVFWLILRFFRHRASAGRSPDTWRDVSVATFSAGIFAAHPVVVEPVTWVAGREELLMTLGALGCLHFHVTARHLGEGAPKTRSAWVGYIGAALCCAGACLSNAVAAVIPMLIVTWDVLTLQGPKFWRIVRGTSALWVIGVATIVIKRFWALKEATVVEPGIFSAEWLMLILNVYWVNLKKLAWPTKLAVSYSSLSPESLLAAEVILGGIAVVLTLLILWSVRRRKLLLYGLVWFGIALAPASQIMSHHVHHADRFLYLPLVGLVVAAALGLRPLVHSLRGRRRGVGFIAAAVAGTFLTVTLSARQVWTWENGVSMWEHCLSLDPDNATAHDYLGNLLTNLGQSDRAEQHFKRAMELDSESPEMLRTVALQLASFEDQRLRNYPEAIRMATRACELSRWENPRYVRGLATVYSFFAQSLQDSGNFSLAIKSYKNAVKVDPKFAPASYNLALLLVNCPDEKLRRPHEAVALAERVSRLMEQPGAEHLRILAEVYAAVGRLGEAAAAAEKAIQLAQAAGNSRLAEEIRPQSEFYRNHSRNGPVP